MPKSVMAVMPIIGAIFLLLAVIKFLNGTPWIVWVILGFLFGGFGIFAKRSGGDAA